MTTMRAKLSVTGITNYGTTSEGLTFKAVSKDGTYPADGSDEDNSFARFTPQADLTMVINNPDLLGKYKIGDKVYVDFSPAQ